MGKKIWNASINGVEIPNEGICKWCGHKLERKGPTYMGSGVNSFTLFCSNCGAIEHHAHEFGKEITGCKIKYIFAGEEE